MANYITSNEDGTKIKVNVLMMVRYSITYLIGPRHHCTISISTPNEFLDLHFGQY